MQMFNGQEWENVLIEKQVMCLAEGITTMHLCVFIFLLTNKN